MRNIFFLLLAASFFLGACKDDDVTSTDYFEALEQDTVLWGAGEGEQTVTLNTNLFVTPELDAAGAEWCEVEFRPIPPRLLIHVQPNPNGEMRSTIIRLKTDLLQRSLCVRQLGQNPAIVLSPDSYKVSQAATVLKVPFVANVDIQVNPLANWITYKEMISGNQADTLVFDIAATVEISRRADVELTYGTEVKTLLHIVQQAEDTTYVPANPEGLVKKVEVAEVTAPDDVKMIGGELKDIIDGDIATGWSGYSEQAALSLIFKFQDVEQVDYIIYKADAKYYGPIQKIDLYVQRKGETEFTKYGTTYNVNADHGSVVKMPCPDPILQPQAIRMDITGYEVGNKQYGQCAEMEFYAFNAAAGSVFTDKTCSALQETVTIEQIQAMENTFLRNLAMHLYSGTYDTEFRVQEYAAYMNPDLQRLTTKTSSFSYLEDPTGISVKAGEEIVMLVGDTHGEQIGVMLMDWENMTYPKMKPEPKYILEEGTNVFTADRDGLLYIYYMVNDVTGKQPVKIHIPTGEVNGYFNIYRHTNSQWKQLLQTKAKHKFLDVQGKLTHLLFPSDDFRAFCPDDVVRLLEVSDSIAFMEHDMAGLYKYNRDNMNRMFCRITYETGDFAAFATAYHTAYIPGEVKIICDRLRKEPWAMAHEFGHCHQIESFKWKGMTEVSNNVFSLYVQTAFGNESRILAEGCYPQAHDEIAVTGISHSACTNVFLTLVPFWQLQLYFDKVLNQPDFYKDMYEEFRTNEVYGGDGKKQLNFVKQACKYGKKDLTKFFEYWGLLTEDNLQPFPGGQQGQFEVTADEIAQAKSDIAAMELGKALAIQYLKDDNVELFRQNKAVKAGQVTLNGTSLTLTGWENVVAYEVYRAGKLIQVSQKPAFTLPSADVAVKAVAADGTLTDVHF